MALVLARYIDMIMVVHDSGMTAFNFQFDSQIINNTSEYQQTVCNAAFFLCRSELPAHHLLGDRWRSWEHNKCGV